MSATLIHCFHAFMFVFVGIVSKLEKCAGKFLWKNGSSRPNFWLYLWLTGNLYSILMKVYMWRNLKQFIVAVKQWAKLTWTLLSFGVNLLSINLWPGRAPLAQWHTPLPLFGGSAVLSWVVQLEGNAVGKSSTTSSTSRGKKNLWLEGAATPAIFLVCCVRLANIPNEYHIFSAVAHTPPLVWEVPRFHPGWSNSRVML